MLRRVRVWARALARRNVVEREMRQEIEQHLDRATERLMARGMSATASRSQARREFGNVAQIEEEARDARGVRWIEEAAHDLHYALRGLRLRPGFSLAVIATLGLGVGANATMFGIVDRLLFRPPPFLAAPERTHRLYLARTIGGTNYLGQAAQYQRYLDLSSSSRSLDVLAAYSPRRLPVGPPETARETPIGAATASFWRLFDARPVVGRFFSADEDRDPGGARVIVLSYAYWQSAFAGSPSAVGRTVTVGAARYTVIGVAPRGFTGMKLEAPAAFIPLAVTAADEFGQVWASLRFDYAMTWLEIYGRRRSDVSPSAATADLSGAYRESYLKQRALEPGLAAIDVAKPNVVLGSVLAERGPTPSADSRVATWLLGVTIIVLLIACANIGNLLLVKAVGRRREIAVRVALGAGRARLLRQLLMESAVLAVLGAVAGLLIAQWGGQLLRAVLMPTLEWHSPVADIRILTLAGTAALAAAGFAAIAPLVQASRTDVIVALKTGAREGGGAPSRLRGALMLVQVTLSVVLLIGAGLFVRSVQRVSDVRLGYDADRLLVVDTYLRGVTLDSAAKHALRDILMARATAHPMVETATLACSVPFFGTCASSVFVAGVDSTARFGEFVRQAASPTYFATTGTRILRGRAISPDDRAGSALVVVVSDAMARALWPSRDAIGGCMRAGSATAPCRTVVGVAEDSKQSTLSERPALAYYYPAAQAGEREWGDPQKVRLLVRVRGEASAQSDAIRHDLQRAMGTSVFVIARPMESILAPVTRSWRLGATMFVVFGALALTLAAIGLYSIVAYGVAQRRHEMGVRIALGARASTVVALVLRDGLRIVIVGAIVGMGVSLASGRWIRPLLFEVSPRDPLVFAAVAIVLLVVAVVAAAVPAMRASRVDPAASLRAD